MEDINMQPQLIKFLINLDFSESDYKKINKITGE